MSLAATGPEQAQLAANPDPASSKPTLSPASAKTIDRFERLDIAAGIIADNETWSCVADNQTALVWEVKTIDGGIRDITHSYSWFDLELDSQTGVEDGGRV